ncbi:MAG: glycoside hydrolase family 43 protein [Clostridiales bacterium]|nr:glycoside hydrolase family 43 protein [Clostridiales bacterium]
MKNQDINIRDPFVVYEDGKYYMFGTRAASFGINTGGFDVYVSDDLENWSEPVECFNSAAYGLNSQVNWAPEVHRYKGAYYLFATFTKDNGLRGTYILRSDTITGPYMPHSKGAVTPYEWECLDGTLYIEDDIPYLVFCHEHTQITDGTICFVRLHDDLTEAMGEPITLFSGSSPFYILSAPDDGHYVTDGPFMVRTSDDTLLMLWSTFINNQYAECLVRFKDKSIHNEFEHLDPLIDNDGGHGMIFMAKGKTMLTYHTPNRSGYEHPHFVELKDTGNSFILK